MKKIDIYEELKSNDYPGRGIVIGKSADGKSAVTAPKVIKIPDGGQVQIACSFSKSSGGEHK